MKNLRIVGITSENVKNLKLVHIEPKDDVIVISGPNAAGKSALLDSFWLALAGKDALKNYPDPIRHGEDHAKIEIDLDDIVVTRTWTPTNTYLKIENKEGAIFKSPQAMLDKFIGKLSFDPAEFALQSEKKQATTLMNLLGLSEILKEHEAHKKKIFDERTIVNRQIRDTSAQLKSMEVPANVPSEEISTIAIMENYQAAIEKVNNNNQLRSKLSQLSDMIKVHETTVAGRKDLLSRAEADLEKTKNDMASLTQEVDELKDPDIEWFKCNIEDAENINKLVRLKATKDQLLDTYTSLEIKSKEMTQELIDIDKEKSKSIRNTKLPLDNLGFNENGVTYNDAPLKQCSSAERLRVSIAVAMALNPTLRVIRIADGSLLDTSNMKIVEEMAKEHDFQVWVEVVDESGKMGIYIEDGSIVKDNYEIPAGTE